MNELYTAVHAGEKPEICWNSDRETDCASDDGR